MAAAPVDDVPSEDTAGAGGAAALLCNLGTDVQLSCLGMLDVASLCAAQRTCRLLFVLGVEVQRQPFMVTDAGKGPALLARLRGQLRGTPTLGFSFFTDPHVELGDAQLRKLMLDSLPLGIELIGARVSRGGATATCTSARGGRSSSGQPLSKCSAADTMALTLAHFPEARCRSFLLDRDRMQIMAEQGIGAVAAPTAAAAAAVVVAAAASSASAAKAAAAAPTGVGGSGAAEGGAAAAAARGLMTAGSWEMAF